MNDKSMSNSRVISNADSTGNSNGNVGRIDYLDLTKCFAILCVLMGHVWQWSYPGNPYEDSTLFQGIYAFHMPLFMTVCGFFLGKSLSAKPMEFVSRRATQLLLPVLSFSIVYLMLLFAVLSPLMGWEMVSPLTYLSGGDMWFLKYLFACLVVAYVCKALLRKTWVAALLPTILLFSLTRSGIFRLLPYLWLGYYVFTYRHLWERYTRYISLITGILFAICLFYWKGEYDGNYRFVVLHSPIHIVWDKAAVVWFRLLVGSVGSMFFITLFKLLDGVWHGGGLKNYLCSMGQHTLGIYCLQIYFLEKLTDQFPIDMDIETSVPLRLLVFLLEAVMLNELVKLLLSNRWTALFFLGKK